MPTDAMPTDLAHTLAHAVHGADHVAAVRALGRDPRVLTPHELLHLVLARVARPQVNDIDQEQAVESLSRAIVGLTRGCRLSSHHPHSPEPQD